MRAPYTKVYCKAGERIKAKLPRTMTEVFEANQRIDQCRTIRETALPILKQPVL